MEGRTYRFLRSDPLYAFGHGLSYTSFAYHGISATAERDGSVAISATVTNSGKRAGDEVVQCYVADLQASHRVPTRSLRGIERVTLAPGESRRVEFRIAKRDLCLIDPEGRAVFEPGAFRISIGGRQPDAAGGTPAATSGCIETTVEVGGERGEMAW